MIDAAVVVHTAEGKVTIDETADPSGKKWAKRGAIAGGVVGLIFPPSIILSAAVGGGAGGVWGKIRDKGFKDDDLKAIGNSMPPGTSAIIAVAEDRMVEQMERSLAGLREDREACGLGRGRGRDRGRGGGRRRIVAARAAGPPRPSVRRRSASERLHASRSAGPRGSIPGYAAPRLRGGERRGGVRNCSRGSCRRTGSSPPRRRLQARIRYQRAGIGGVDVGAGSDDLVDAVE